MATAEGKPPPDYVVIGHLSVDLVDGEERPGGTALYAGVTAARLGRRVGIVTALAGPVPPELSEVPIAGASSDWPTSFEHRSTEQGRSLRLLSQAESIEPAAIPDAWRLAALVHLAPIVNEIFPEIGACFAQARVLATPQGWLRRWDASGCVTTSPARTGLSRLIADTVVLSLEDLNGGLAAADELTLRFPVVVVTAGEEGCIAYARGHEHHIPCFPSAPLDTTGAGDVFATAFFIRLEETEDPQEAAYFAAVAAGLSVQGPGASCVADRTTVAANLAAWRTSL